MNFWLNRIFLILLFFTSHPFFLQESKNSNVMFFYFDEENGNKVYKNNGGPFEKISYVFQLDEDGEEGKKYFDNNSITLQYRVFDNFDTMTRKDSTLVFTIDKSFLKKNKGIIITKDDLNAMSKKILFQKLDNNNKLFLISKSEINDGELVMRQVFFTYTPRI